ncbi:MAG: aldo/keto reductase [Corynebacterium sp.]|nr:aldo/keto reductase [Corynebacterium sp.]
MKNIAMSNGVEIPAVGFGVYQIPPEQTQKAVEEALEVGYTHFDTAQFYFNEAELGAALKATGVDRSTLFITTKVWFSNYGDGKTAASIDESLEKLGTDYADLILLHQPFGDTYGAWRDLEKAYEEKKVRAIGVSNFAPDRVVDLGTFNNVMPMINQIETNPFHQRQAEHAEYQKRGIVHEAWAPFGEGRNNLFSNEVLAGIGAKYNKSVAQVVMRWLVQNDVVALAKSVHKDRMAQNIDIFDFELSAEDLAAIAALDTGSSLFFEHTAPATVDFMAGLNR